MDLQIIDIFACVAGVPDRDPDKGLHRGGARAGVPGGGGGGRGRGVVTRGGLVPVLPRPALSALSRLHAGHVRHATARYTTT